MGFGVLRFDIADHALVPYREDPRISRQILEAYGDNGAMFDDTTIVTTDILI